jgi:hypothetical protein
MRAGQPIGRARVLRNESPLVSCRARPGIQLRREKAVMNVENWT